MARRGADLSVLVGLVLGFGALGVGFIFEQGNLLALVGLSALIIILGGTFGALVISYNVVDVLGIFRLIRTAMLPTKGPSAQLLEVLCEFSEKARRDGILSLEDAIEDTEDEFLKKGMRLVVDGTESETIASILENDIYLFDMRRKEESSIFETAGGFSPTMGIIGTVMGLVLVLSVLSEDPKALGHSIATAFIATLYGISFANLFWLPIANKLKYRAKREKLQKEMVLAGVLSIQLGENPNLVRQKLESFISDEPVPPKEERF